MVKHELSQYLSEAIGTFFLVFFGCGSMILADTVTGYSAGFIPVIWGAVVMVMIYATGHISGAHFNPAVTIAFWAIKRFPTKRLAPYILSQIAGAITASALHAFIFGFDHSFGSTSFESTVLLAFVMEFFLSFILMFVIVSVATDSRAVGELAGIAIGTTVMLCAFVGGPLTKASMNPSRTLAPSIFNGDLSQVYLYFASAILGTVCGALTYNWIKCQKESGDDNHGCC